MRVRLEQSPPQATTCLRVSFSPKKHELLPAFNWKYEVSLLAKRTVMLGGVSPGSDVQKDFEATLLSPGFSFLIKNVRKKPRLEFHFGD